METLKSTWEQVSALLRGKLRPDIYERWIKPIVPVRRESETLYVLGVPQTFFLEWMEGLVGRSIEEAFSTVIGTVCSVKYERLVKETPAAAQENASEGKADAAAKRVLNKARVYKSVSGFEFSRRYTFDTFVVGDGNTFAYNACRAVAETPGTAYNPLFLYSRSGLGKTHLLQAIAQEIMDRNPRARIEYVTTEDLCNQYVDALRKNAVMEFRMRYRKVDVLLVDDVQFLGAKDKFQEEFFHTFNALYSSHKQIVIASDRPSSEIPGLEQRLVTRFESGLTADIAAPDLETREAIIRKKQEVQEIKLSDDAIKYLASHLKSNVRRLEGALTTLILRVKFQNLHEITVPMAEEILAPMLSEETGVQLTVEEIQRRVAEHFKVRFSDMMSRCRTANIAWARQVAMYFSHKLTEQSFPNIARQFERNHATVIYACENIAEKLSSSPEFKCELAALERQLTK